MSVQLGIGSNAGGSVNYFNISIPVAGGAKRILQQNPTNQGKHVDVPKDFVVNYVQIANNGGHNNVKVDFQFHDGKKVTAQGGNQVTGLHSTIEGATADARN